MSYEDEVKELYLKKESECGLELGDKVKILYKPASSLGWSCSWNSKMSKYVGSIGEITSINRGHIDVRCDSNTWCYPFFVLEKVEPKKRFMTRYEVLAFILDNPKMLIRTGEDCDWELPQYTSLAYMDPEWEFTLDYNKPDDKKEIHKFEIEIED